MWESASFLQSREESEHLLGKHSQACLAEWNTTTPPKKLERTRRAVALKADKNRNPSTGGQMKMTDVYYGTPFSNQNEMNQATTGMRSKGREA